MRTSSGSLAGAADLDLARMRQDRQRKLAIEMDRQEVDALVLWGTGSVHYATGALWLTSEAERAFGEAAVAIVSQELPPHLFTAYPEGAPPELPVDRLHGPFSPDFAEGARVMAARITDLLGSGALRVGFDQLSAVAMCEFPKLLPNVTVVDAGPVLAAAKLLKTPDELKCLRQAQKINELAMYDVYAALRPGVRQSDLTGIFLRRISELGATANMIDPIWQVTPFDKADGPFTVNLDLAFPIPSSDRILRDGDVIFVDTGISYEGYCSDFGRTWLVGDRPPTRWQVDQFKRWKDVMQRVLEVTKPGTTGRDLTRAATNDDERRPWLNHLYLAHGLGTESAEMPFVGTDLGHDFDEGIVLEPGMVIVLEPVIYEEGRGGYRSEDVLAITEDGHRWLSNFPYVPYDSQSGQW